MLTDGVVYDPSTNSVHYDAATLQNVHDSIGDFAGGLLLATAWSSAVEHQLGAPLGTDSAAPRGRVPGRRLGGRRRASSLSPGDLDEAVTVLVSAGQGDADRGTAFDRVAAFRDGFRHGPSQCVQSS